MIADHVNFANLSMAIDSMRWRIYDHPIIIPNLIYLLFAPYVAFDARAFILLTAGCFLAVAITMRRAGLSRRGVLLASLILASPSHYMEFLWGFQFTLTMSIWLPVIGLVILDRGTRNGTLDLKSTVLFAVLLAIGLLSSAPAAFCLLAAIPLVALKPIPIREKTGFVLLMVSLFVATAVMLNSSGGRAGSLLQLGQFLSTAVGSVLLSSPVGLFEFGADARSLFGGLLLALVLALFAAGASKGQLSALALPAALVVYGTLMVSAVALTRGYLGNWHIQMAIPIVLGAILLADHCWSAGGRNERSLAIVVLGVALTGLIGTWDGFITRGPAYAQYALSVTQYMRDIRSAPAQEKPFPTTGGWDVTAKMVDFLRDKKNPSFLDR